MTYFRALMNGEIDHVSDMLELVESHYLPRIESDKKEVKFLFNKLQ